MCRRVAALSFSLSLSPRLGGQWASSLRHEKCAKIPYAFPYQGENITEKSPDTKSTHATRGGAWSKRYGTTKAPNGRIE